MTLIEIGLINCRSMHGILKLKLAICQIETRSMQWECELSMNLNLLDSFTNSMMIAREKKEKGRRMRAKNWLKF